MKMILRVLFASYFLLIGCTMLSGDDVSRSGGDLRDEFQGFRPQSRREEELFRLMLELNKELTALRNEVREARSEQTGEPRIDINVSKYEKAFAAIDKNGDGNISLEEHLATKNYEVTGARLLNEKLYHLADDLNRNGGVSIQEFALAREQRQAGSWVQTRLLEVNASDFMVVVESRGGERSEASERRVLRVEPRAVISVKGQEAELADLASGQTVYVFMAHDKRSVIGLTQR